MTSLTATPADPGGTPPSVPQRAMLVDGEWVAAVEGRWLDVENPARRGSVMARVPRADAEDVDRAVQAAARAFESWKDVPPRTRGRLLMRIADRLEEQSETIARTIATETGNALRPQSRPEANNSAEIFRYFGGLASELKGETVPLGEHVLSYTRREPLGVVGASFPGIRPCSSALSRSPWQLLPETRWS